MKKVDFREGTVFSNLIQTATPMLIAQVLHLLYNIVDRVYIGRIPNAGTDALGAVGLCFPIILIITGFTNMYGMGGSPLFSMELGRGDPEKAAQIQNTAFRLLTVTALIITVVGECFATPLLRLFGAGNAELPTALSYFRYYLPGTLFAMVSTGMNPYITGQGFSMVAMISVAAGAV
ncbi:MAG: MATE family efflux transporter, partial [Lachnospiraceae bacterium]|nr:MATE family efflux transporter [Lachnospiraceae bacterium]